MTGRWIRAFGLAVVAVSASSAFSQNLLLNPGFESASTDEWRRDAAAGGGKAETTTTQRNDGKFSLKLTPAPAGCAGGCQIAFSQNLDTGSVVGRRITLSGWVLASGGDRGLAMRLTASTAGPGTVPCSVSSPPGPSVWVQFRGSCSLPTVVYAAEVRFVTTGSTGSLYVDDLSVTASTGGSSFQVMRRAATVTPVPGDAEIVMLSTRHGESDGAGIPTREVYAMNGESGNVTRLTHSGHSHGHVAVSPDRDRLAVVRFGEDLNKDGSYDALKDPQALWVVDLEAGEEWQLLPSWYWSGVGGVDWTPDGEWVVFGMYTGRFGKVYKIRPDGSDLTLISPDDAWASDVAVSADGEWLVYHRQPRSADGSFENTGGVWRMRIDGTDNAMVTSGGGHPPGTQGGWAIGDFDPELSPDGTQVVFASNNPDSGGWDIVRSHLDGSGRTTLVQGSPTRWAGIPGWGAKDLILFSLWQGGGAPYQGGVTVKPDGTAFALLEPGLADPTDGGVWVRWIPSLPLPELPRVRRRLGGSAGGTP